MVVSLCEFAQHPDGGVTNTLTERLKFQAPTEYGSALFYLYVRLQKEKAQIRT
jgi:hypothetical protein